MNKPRTMKKNDGTVLYSADVINDSTGGSRGSLVHACTELWSVCDRSRGMVNDYKVFKKYVPILLKSYCLISEINDDYSKMFDENCGGEKRKKNKRWTPEEDEMLIEYLCLENEPPSQVELALAFGRTPAAIKTRVSHLVGIGRISQKVAGRFIGTINGEEIEGRIEGTVMKGKMKNE